MLTTKERRSSVVCFTNAESLSSLFRLRVGRWNEFSLYRQGFSVNRDFFSLSLTLSVSLEHDLESEREVLYGQPQKSVGHYEVLFLK